MVFLSNNKVKHQVELLKQIKTVFFIDFVVVFDMQNPIIKVINGVPVLPFMYPGEVIQDRMRIDDIRFHKNWTKSSNFHEQIEALEISHEWVEKLKCDHDYRMQRLLRNHYLRKWTTLALRFLAGSGTEIRTLRMPCSLDILEVEVKKLQDKYYGAIDMYE